MNKKGKYVYEDRLDKNIEVLIEKYMEGFEEFTIAAYNATHRSYMVHKDRVTRDRDRAKERYKAHTRRTCLKCRYGADDPRTIEAKNLIPPYPKRKG